MAMPSGTMKVIEATLIAIWCPATVASPSEPISSVVETAESTTLRTCCVTFWSQAALSFAQPMPHWTQPGGPFAQQTGPTPSAPSLQAA